jgi:hypothetical protein
MDCCRANQYTTLHRFEIKVVDLMRSVLEETKFPFELHVKNVSGPIQSKIKLA